MAHDDWSMIMSLIPDLSRAKVSLNGNVVCGSDMQVNVESRILHDFFNKIREQEKVGGGHSSWCRAAPHLKLRRVGLIHSVGEVQPYQPMYKSVRIVGVGLHLT